MTRLEPTPGLGTESRIRMSPDLARAAGVTAVSKMASPSTPPLSPDSSSGSRLKGKLLATAESAKTEDLLQLSETLPGLEGTAEQTISLFDGKATLVVGADIRGGAWHYSSSVIEAFHRDRVSTGGKFGPGTYLGVGNLAGETVDGLKSGGAKRHDVGLSGNILALSRGQVLEVASELRARKGVPASRVVSAVKNAPLTTYLDGLKFDGLGVDAVMIYMDPEQTAAEIAVLPNATSNLGVLGVE